MTAESLMLVGGVASFLLTVHWVRKRDLREKYAVAWLGAATLVLLCGLFPQVIMVWAAAAHLSYAAAVLFIVLAVIYPLAFSVSVTLTRQYRRNARLIQEVALLEYRLRAVEQRLREKEGEATAAATQTTS